MQTIVECVMNVSEGRDRGSIRSIGDAIQRPPHVSVLDVSSDISHHRSVYTFIGSRESICEGALSGIAEATRLLDLRRHAGVHPRIGVADVVPFIPIRGVDMEECAAIAKRLGERVGSDLKLPVYLYGNAALRDDRRELSSFRRLGREKLQEKMGEMDYRPDFGPGAVHETAGAVAIGARGHLIALNLYLETDQVEIARSIAARIREKGGGLPGVRALGLQIEHRQQVQVSMNLTDPDRASISAVYDHVRGLASDLGVTMGNAELIGLVSRRYLTESVAGRIRLEDFGVHRFLEDRIESALARLWTGAR